MKKLWNLLRRQIPTDPLRQELDDARAAYKVASMLVDAVTTGEGEWDELLEADRRLVDARRRVKLAEARIYARAHGIEVDF